jgi:hypothetical protein
MTSPYDRGDYDPLDTFAFEALSVGAAAVGFTAATMAGTAATGKPACAAFCTVEGAPIRMRADGTNPTATVGTPFDVGDTFVVWGSRDLQSVRFIRQGGVSATLSTHFARQVA